jgi:ribosomal-protein-alanine N-acetyltransferase
VAILLTTERLVVRDWEPTDAEAALAIYGAEEVGRWLVPEITRVEDVEQMRGLLEQWRAQRALPTEQLGPTSGQWALVRREDDELVGSLALRTMPPHDEDLELTWQLAPAHWGRGYAIEGARALAAWAFDQQSAHELFAVVRPANQRAAALARRLGMEWVGETDKYYDLTLQVYRLRPVDLQAAAAGA